MPSGPKRRAPLWFILRRGVVPWGLIVGLAAAGGGAATSRRLTDAPPGSRATTITVATLSFVIWGGLAGWAVGVVRWELRRSNDA